MTERDYRTTLFLIIFAVLVAGGITLKLWVFGWNPECLVTECRPLLETPSE